jgi:hypothetical protein
MAQAVQEQAAIGQAGELVVESQLRDLVFGRLAFGDVGKGADVVGDLALSITYRSDAQPFRKDFAALAPVPDFTLPVAGAHQAVPHRIVEAGVMPSRAEHVRRLSDRLLGGIAGDLGKGAIDTQDHACSHR